MFDLVNAALGGLARHCVSEQPTTHSSGRRIAHCLAWALAALTLVSCGGGGGGDGSSSGNGGGGGQTPLATAIIASGQSDTLTLPGILVSGSSTDDTTPTLSGTVSTTLSPGQQVLMFENDTPLAPAAIITGLQWQFTPLQPLTEGEHRFSAVVVGTDGKVGQPSPAFALNVKKTKVTIASASSDTPTLPGDLAEGSSTDDKTPTLRGTVNMTLGAGQRMVLFDGVMELTGTITVAGQDWAFTPEAPLTTGPHDFSAAVVNGDGRVAIRSEVFSLTVYEMEISIYGATSNTLTQPGAIIYGNFTDDATPTINGSISTDLANGQKIFIYDGQNQLLPAATVSGQAWEFTPTAPLPQGPYRFSAAVVSPSGYKGAESDVFPFAVSTPFFQGVSPSQVTRATLAEITFSGGNWPTTGMTVVPLNPALDRCTSISTLSNNNFKAECTFEKIGTSTLDIRMNGQSVAQAQVNVISNVAAVNWKTPRSNFFAAQPVLRSETVRFWVSGTQLIGSPGLRLTVGEPSICQSAPVETLIPGQTARFFECMISSTANVGTAHLSIKVDDPSTGLPHTIWEDTKLPVQTVSTLKTAPTGTTQAQCYSGAMIGNFVSCSSAGAINYSGADKQDGMLAAANNGRYSSVGSYGKDECVKDNLTGLIWEGKTTSGLRAGKNFYSQLDFSEPEYVSAVNSLGLCGYKDWRLPTVEELHSLVDYSKMYPGPMINTLWFPNTQSFVYATTFSESQTPGAAWRVNFSNGSIGSYSEPTASIRLVRESQQQTQLRKWQPSLLPSRTGGRPR